MSHRCDCQCLAATGLPCNCEELTAAELRDDDEPDTGDFCSHGKGFDEDCAMCDEETDEDDDDVDLIEEGVCEHGNPLWEFCDDCEA